MEFAALQCCDPCVKQRGAAFKILRAMFGPRPELTLRYTNGAAGLLTGEQTQRRKGHHAGILA